MSDNTKAACDLLVVQSATEPIVLAKLLQALRPPRVLHLTTPDGRRKGNDDGVLERFRREDIVREVTRCDLPSLSEVANGADVSALIEARLRAALAACQPPARVVVDTTRGLGLHRMLTQAAVQRVVDEVGHHLAAACADPDKVQVLVVPLLPAGPTKVLPIRFALDDRALERRFSLSGSATIQAQDPAVRLAPQLLHLLHAMVRHAPLRALFHSRYAVHQAWHCRRRLVAGQAAAAIETAILEFGAHVADLLANLALDRAVIEQAVRDAVAAFHCGDDSNAFWLAAVSRDPGLKGLRTVLNGLDGQLHSLAAAAARRAGPVRVAPEQAKGIVHARKVLQESMSKRLYAALKGPAPSGAPGLTMAALYAGILPEVLAEVGIGGDPEIAGVLAQHEPSVLLELCVAAALDAAPGGSGGSVRVWQNGHLHSTKARAKLAEFDAVALAWTGDLAVVEAKTHHSTATHKDIESRIKQLRDHGGAGSAYYIVYPMLQSEIEVLQSGDNRRVSELNDSWISDLPTWFNYAAEAGRTRDQKLIGLDQLPNVIDTLARRAA